MVSRYNGRLGRVYTPRCSIEKYKDSWGDIATGCIYEDKENHFGYGENTLVAYLTRYGKDQTTHVYFSTDNGYSYTPYQNNPIQYNPGNNADFRDPFVFKQDNVFYMYLAEGNKFGIYQSSDGLNFSYMDCIIVEDKGILECPGLLHMDIYGKETSKWVFTFGANDWELSTGTHYMVGELVNGVFKPETGIKRLDNGPDFYASKVFHYEEDSRESALGIGWMGNWEYSKEIPNCGHVGCVSLCRLIYLNDDLKMCNTLFPSYQNYLSVPATGYGIPLTGSLKKLHFVKGEKFLLKIMFESDTGVMDNYFGFLLKGDNYSLKVHHNPFQHEISLERQCNDFPENDVFNRQRIIKNVEEFKDVEILLAVDSTSVEIIYGDGSAASLLKFGNLGKESVSVYSDGGGTASFEYYDFNL